MRHNQYFDLYLSNSVMIHEGWGMKNVIVMSSTVEE